MTGGKGDAGVLRFVVDDLVAEPGRRYCMDEFAVLNADTVPFGMSFIDYYSYYS